MTTEEPEKPEKRNELHQVVFPGDTFTPKQATGRVGKLRIGIGLTPSVVHHEGKSQEAVLVTRAGVLSLGWGKPAKLWVNSRQRRV